MIRPGLILATALLTTNANATANDCATVIDKLRITRPLITFLDKQLAGHRTDFSEAERDIVGDYLSKTALSNAYFVSMFNKVDSTIPVRDVNTVLAIINLQENSRMPLERILDLLRAFKHEFDLAVKHRGQKELGFLPRVDHELTWDETIPFFVQFGRLSAKNGKLAITDYVEWSVANGVTTRESLLTNVSAMNYFDLHWERVRSLAPNLMRINFEAKEIGFHAASSINPSLDESILVLGHLNRTGVDLEQSESYVREYVAARSIGSPSDLVAALENDPTLQK